jgi:arsenate reductase
MHELGIDISQQKSKGFNDLPAKNFDYVVTMGCKDVCPFVPGNEHIEWKIEDPKGKGLVFFKKVRDEIKQKVQDLVDELF